LLSGKNNVFTNDSITALSAEDIWIEDGEGFLYNVTFNTTNITFHTEGPGGAIGNLTVNWYVDFNISNSSGSPLQGVTVSVSNVSGVEVFSGTTDGNGTISTLSLNEFFQNASDKIYATPHTINVSKTGYTSNSTTINLTTTGSILVPLALNLSVAGGTLTLTETLEPSTVESGATVYVSGNSSFVNGTGNVYSVINFSSGTDNITYHWFDNDTTDGSTFPFRWAFVLESSVTEINKPVIISGQDLLDSTPGLSLASIDIGKILIVDPDGTPTGNEENGHELISTFNDLDSDSVFDATDYVNFTANITANTKKLLYLYDDPVENIPKIVNAYVNPIKVQPGDVMTITVEAEDDSGIKEVIAEMPYEGGSDLVNLELVNGTVNNGTWQGEWIVHDTLVKDYTTIITVINLNDVSSKSIIEWRDPTPQDCNADGSASSTNIACNAGTCYKNEDSTDATIDSCTDATQTTYMSVQNVYLDASSVSPGDTITVNCEINCYSSSTRVAIAYNNGTGWRNVYTGSCSISGAGGSSCPTGRDVNTTLGITVDNVIGTHTVRCMEQWSTSFTSTSTCTTGSYADNDDMEFEVVSAVTGPTINSNITSPATVDISDNVIVTANVTYASSTIGSVVFNVTNSSGALVITNQNGTNYNTDLWNTSSFSANETGIWNVDIEAYGNDATSTAASATFSVGVKKTVYERENRTDVDGVWLTDGSGRYNMSFVAPSALGEYIINVNSSSDGSEANNFKNLTVVDSTNPSVTSFNATPINLTSSTSITVQATVTDGGGVANVTVDSGTKVTMSASGDVWSATTTPSAMGCSEGSCTLTVVATDVSSNVNNSVTTNILVDDTTPSSLSYQSPTSADGATIGQNFYEVSLTFTDTNPNNCLLEVGGTNYSMSRSGTTCTITRSGQADGTYTYKVYVNDTSGNIGTSSSRSVTLDTTPSSVSMISPTPDNNSKQDSTTVTINVTVTDALSNIDNCTLDWNGVNETMTKEGSGTTVSCSTVKSGLVDPTTYSYKVYANDVADNLGENVTRIVTITSLAVIENILGPINDVAPTTTLNITGNIALTEGTKANYTMLHLTSTSNLSYNWFDNDTSDPFQYTFRFPLIVNTSGTATNGVIVVTGQDLIDANPGLSLAAIDIDKLRIVDPNGTAINNEKNGHGIPSLFFDQGSVGTFEAADSINFSVNLSDGNHKLFYLYDPLLEIIPEAKTKKPVITKMNLKKLKIKEIKPDIFAFKSLSEEIIEIGEERHSPPQPYLKLNKWGGEVTLKVHVPYVQGGEKSMDGNKIKWTSEKYDAEFYPKEPQEITDKDSQGNEYTYTINEDGGIEFDLILKEKPESNIFEFPMETEGLTFYYQPPLNEEEDGDCTESTCYDEDGIVIAFRAENVIGSYAVYHESKIGNEYKSGKAFHIYRPEVEDAAGNKIWGELSIDEKTEILTVTVDQDWLDNAVYPVTIDPNFGYETIGGTQGYYTNTWIVGASGTTGTDVGVVQSITVAYKSSSTVQCSAAIYTSGKSKVDEAGEEDVSGNTAAWHTFTITDGTDLDDSTSYILVGNCNGGNGITYTRYDSGTGGWQDDYAYGTWPTTGLMNAHSRKSSYYATTATPPPAFVLNTTVHEREPRLAAKVLWLTDGNGDYNTSVEAPINTGNYFVTVNSTFFDIHGNNTTNFSVLSGPPVVNYVTPTPANNTKQESTTVTVNVTASTVGSNIDTCTLEWNGVNESMAEEGAGSSISCSRVKSSLTTGTTYNYKVHVINTIGFKTVTELRDVIINIIPTTPTLNAPADASSHSVTDIILNATISDGDSDAMNVSIYADNTTAAELISFQENVASGSVVTYNFTSPTVGDRFAGDSSLVGYWKLDQNATDKSGQGNDGTLVNGSTINLTGGKIGGGAVYDGDGGYVDLPRGAFDSLTEGTVSAWIKRDISGVGVIHPIIGAQDGSTNIGYLYWIRIVDDKVRIRVRTGSSGTNAISANGSTVLDANKWHHIVYTVESGVGNKYFVNGKQETMIYETGDSTNTEFFNAVGGASLYYPVGSRMYKGVTAFELDGTVDEVAIWNRALTANEILDLYKLGEITYSWKVNIDDGTSNANSATRTFTIDRTDPTITLDAPVNQQYATTTIDLKVSSNEDIHTWWYSLNNASNQTFTPNTTVSAAGGANTILVYANDSAGNLNSSQVNFTVDSDAPGSLTYVVPTIADNTRVSRGWYAVNLTFTDNNPDTCDLEVGGTNYSMDRVGSSCFINKTSQADGTYNYKVYVTDLGGNVGQSTPRTIILDRVNPEISILSPINTAYAGASIDLNVSSNEDIHTWWYSFDNGVNNTTFTPNTTIVASDGVNTLNVFANDTAGNLNNTENVTFTVDGDVPVSLVYVAPTEPDAISVSRGWYFVNLTFSDANPNNCLLDVASVKYPMTRVGSSCYINRTSEPDGTFTFQVDVNDSAGNLVTSSSRTITLDRANPSVAANTSVYPGAQTAAKDGDVVLLRATLTDALAGIRNATVEAGNACTSTTTLTLVSGSLYTGNCTIINGVTQGTKSLTVSAYDNAGNLNASEVLSVEIDTTLPTINITLPINTTYTVPTINLSVSASETINLWTYSLNGAANVTFTPNTTFNASGGSNTLIVYAKDLGGNVVSSTVSFTVYICGATLTSDLTLTQHLTSIATCFTVGANNVVIDGNGYRITGIGTGHGIDTAGYDNIVIKNFKNIKNFSTGIYLSGTTRATIFNNTIRSANLTNTYGVYLNESNSNNFTNNTIRTWGNDSDVIVFNASSDNVLYRNRIRARGNNSFGINLVSGTNNTITHSKILPIEASDIIVDDGVAILTNVSYNRSGISFVSGGTGNITTRWYIDVEVKEWKYDYYEGHQGSSGFCGDGRCGFDESDTFCPEDCSVSTVADSSFCHVFNQNNCILETSCQWYGGQCEPYLGGGFGFCGDLFCGFGETSATCEIDCGGGTNYCGDGICANTTAENSTNCALDCGSGNFTAFCGDGYCSLEENPNDCSADCWGGGYCGDGFCGEFEDQIDCSLDCNGTGSAGTCGDSVCGPGEYLENCPTDCGATGGSESCVNLSNAQCTVADHCFWDSGECKYDSHGGGFITCGDYVTDVTCDQYFECDWDGTTCNSGSNVAGCAIYQTSPSCITNSSCQWDSYSSSCLAQSGGCGAYGSSSSCNNNATCEWNVNTVTCQDKSATGCSTYITAPSCGGNSSCEWNSTTASCQDSSVDNCNQYSPIFICDDYPECGWDEGRASGLKCYTLPGEGGVSPTGSAIATITGYDYSDLFGGYFTAPANSGLPSITGLASHVAGNDCGNDECDAGEDTFSCPNDCGDPETNRIPGVSVKIYDVFGNLVSSQITDSNGEVNTMILTEFVQTEDSKTYYTTYSVNVSKEGLVKKTRKLNLTSRRNTLLKNIMKESFADCGVYAGNQTLCEVSQCVWENTTQICRPNIALLDCDQFCGECATLVTCQASEDNCVWENIGSGFCHDDFNDFSYGTGGSEIESGYIDFRPVDCFKEPYKCDSRFNVEKAFYAFETLCSDGVDNDNDGDSDCDDSDCRIWSACTAQYNSSTDTTSPKITNFNVEAFHDFVSIDWSTTEPTNGTVEFYSVSSDCSSTATKIDVFDDEFFAFDDYMIHHYVPLENGIDVTLASNTTYYYKLSGNDQADLLYRTSCLNFTTDAEVEEFKLHFQGLDQSLFFDFGSGFEEQDLSSGKSFNRTNDIKIKFPDIGIIFEGIDLVKAKSFNFTDVFKEGTSNFSVDNKSYGKAFIGMTTEKFLEMKQNLGLKATDNITISIPAVGDYVYKCDNNATSCTDVSTLVSIASKNSTHTTLAVPVSVGFSSYTVVPIELPAEAASSSGGGGSSTAAVTKDFSISEDLIKSRLLQGESEEHIIKLGNKGSTKTTIDISIDSSLSSLVSVNKESVSLGKGEDGEIIIRIVPGEKAKSGVYLGKIRLSDGVSKRTISVIIDVLPKEALFDIRVELEDTRVKPGEFITGDIFLFNVGTLQPVDIELHSIIMDFDGNEKYSKVDTFAVYGQIHIKRNLQVPEDLADGKYLWYSRIFYEGGEAATSEIFEVRTKDAFVEALVEQPVIIIRKVAPFLEDIMIMIVALFIVLIYSMRRDIGYVIMERNMVYGAKVGKIKRFLETTSEALVKDKVDVANEYYEGALKLFRDLPEKYKSRHPEIKKKLLQLEIKKEVEEEYEKRVKGKKVKKGMEVQRISSLKETKSAEMIALETKIGAWEVAGYDTTMLREDLYELRHKGKSMESMDVVAMRKKLKLWEKVGYDTTELEDVLGDIEKKGLKREKTKHPEVKKLELQIAKWKKKGFDTKILEHKLKIANKKMVDDWEDKNKIHLDHFIEMVRVKKEGKGIFSRFMRRKNEK